eukprot:7107720-Pyramimonas_sp.AAC.1
MEREERRGSAIQSERKANVECASRKWYTGVYRVRCVDCTLITGGYTGGYRFGLIGSVPGAQGGSAELAEALGASLWPPLADHLVATWLLPAIPSDPAGLGRFRAAAAAAAA